MSRSPQQAVHEDDLAGRPANRLDGMLRHTPSVAQQGQVRREAPRRPRPGNERVAEALLKDIETDNAIVAGKYESAVAEAHGAVELDTEWRHRDGGGALHHSLHQPRREAGAIGNMKKRDVKLLRLEQLAGESVPGAHQSRVLGDNPCGSRIGKNSEKQSIRCRALCRRLRFAAMKPSKAMCHDSRRRARRCRGPLGKVQRSLGRWHEQRSHGVFSPVFDVHYMFSSWSRQLIRENQPTRPSSTRRSNRIENATI